MSNFLNKRVQNDNKNKPKIITFIANIINFLDLFEHTKWIIP